MSNQRSKIIFAAIAATIALPVMPAYAVGPTYVVTMPSGTFGSTQYTKVVVSGLAVARQFCGDLAVEYRVDCLAERLGVIAAEIPRDSDYEEVQKVLQSASDELRSLARSQRDSNLPTGRASRSGTSPLVTTRPLTPVKSQSLSQVNAQAQAILDETESVLLRSAGNSQEKLVQYQQIATAVGSNKVLLRST